MNPLWAVYAVAVALLLGAAAHGAERALRGTGRPVRWPWAAAMAGSWLLVVVALARPASPEPPRGEFAVVEVATDAPAAVAEEAGWIEVLAALPARALDPARSRLAVASDAVDAWRERNAAPLAAAGRWLVALWLAASGAAVLVVGLSVARLLRRSRSWPEARVLDEPVRLSPDFGPALLGLRRPRIVLPRWALTLGETPLRLVVEHEREHRRAGDTLLLAAGALAWVAAPWNPALWWQLRRLRLAVELDCDRRVLARGVPAREYGALLVEVGERVGRVGFPAAALAEQSSFLERRLVMITEKRANGGGWKVAGGLALTVAMVAVACETPAPTGVNEGAVPPPATEAVAAGEAPASSDAAGPDGTGEPAGTFELREVEDRDPLRSIPEGALVVVDGVIVDDPEASFEVTRLDVERVEVVRPPVAEELYGARAKNGVVVVTTKAAARREGGAGRYEVREEGRARYEALEEVRVRPKTPAGNPVVYVDGVRVEGGLGAAVIEPRKVDRVEVVKGEAARAIYGEKARDGVVQIFTKERPAATGGVVRLRELPAKRPTVGPIDDAVIFVDGERWTGTAESLGELAIESMEVLSGEAAAAVLEGSGIDGSRKVIRVTTKR